MRKWHKDNPKTPLINKARNKPCVVCGWFYNDRMTLDHKNPNNKSIDLSLRAVCNTNKRYPYRGALCTHVSMEDVRKELKKTQVLCVNCHFAKTAYIDNRSKRNSKADPEYVLEGKRLWRIFKQAMKKEKEMREQWNKHLLDS